MIEFMRRVSFPFSSRRHHGLAARIRRRQNVRRHFNTEPLEQRMLLAADLPIEAYSLFNALSRGGDELMSQAGIIGSMEVSSMEVSAQAPSEPVAPDTPAAVPANDVAETVASTTEILTERSGVLSNSFPLEDAEGENGDFRIKVGDGVFVIYNGESGAVRLETLLPVTTLSLSSASGIFTGADALNLGGTFDIDTDFKIFKLTGNFSPTTGEPLGFGSITFGPIAQTGLANAFVQNDLTITGSVIPPGSLSNKEVEIEVFATNVNGGRILEIPAGQDFKLHATVKDARSSTLTTDNVGVFAAYFDVLWDDNLAVAVGLPEFSSEFSTATSGTVSDGMLDEVGATSSSLTPTTDQAQTLFTQDMRAVGAGELRLDLNPSDINPGHEVLNFGSTAAISPSRIAYNEENVLTITDTGTATDLVEFAKRLDAAGAIMYGAAWCQHCTDQKELFEDGQEFLPFLEVTNPDRTPNQVGIDAEISSYPTWIFADGTRLTGVQSLEALADAAGISIPESNRPFVMPIEDTTLLSNAPLHLPLDGYDPNGGPLTYTVTSDNPDVRVEVLDGNRSIEIDVNSFGPMVFELFDAEAFRATNRITSLADEGFYDDLKFHRIIDDFMIQGGDPLGNGTGGSDLPDFDDQFDIDLQHNRPGVLSMAKSQDDTNNSQFFITEVPTRHLDFNHTVFGQLIEGEKNRAAISDTAVTGSVPDIDVVINTINVFEDTENALLRISADNGTLGTANITVTVSDTDNHEFTENFEVTVDPDLSNGGPFMEDLPDKFVTQANTPIEIQVEAVDSENDPIRYQVFAEYEDEITVDIEQDGKLTITPAEGFVGTTLMMIRIESFLGSDTNDRYDVQVIPVEVVPNTPEVSLVSSSDSGAFNTDKVTNLADLEFEVTGVDNERLVEVLANGEVIGSATAEGTSVLISTSQINDLGDGIYAITARQGFDTHTSEESAPFTLTYDTTAPNNFTSTTPTNVMTGELFQYDTENAEEGSSGFQYSLVNPPTGAFVDANSGLISWTPMGNQSGTTVLTVAATDAAGNTATQELSVDVEQNELMAVRLRTLDTNNNPTTDIAVGQTVVLEVYVEDLRSDAGDLQGVFAAYIDINFNTLLALPNDGITYGSNFANGQFGTINSTGVDDAGATASEALGAGEFLLMRIPITTLNVGTLEFTTNPADEVPLLDNLLNGLTDAVPAGQISFGTATVEIHNTTIAVDDEFNLLEDSNGAVITVLNNDIRVPASEVLTIDSVSDANNGTVTITNDGLTVTYKPDTNFYGEDNFNYTVRDPESNLSTANVTVTVVEMNDDPTANDDTFSVPEDSVSNTLNVLANDSSQPDDNETLRIESVSNAVNGTVTTDGSVLTYTPTANFIGTETLEYVLSDGRGGSQTASVTITVDEVNDPPSANPDSFTVNEDSVLTINVNDLLDNDNPGSGEDNQTLSITSVSNAVNGTVAINGNTISFTPNANFFGTASFEYTIQDDGVSNGVSDAATAVGEVSITIDNVNDNPIAVDDIVTAQSGAGSILIDVLDNDNSGPDVNETLSVADVSSGSDNGTISINNNGQIEYVPAAGFSGTETFTYTLSDGNGGTDTATVTATVQNFVPGGIAGFVFNDADNDGIRDADENSLVGVKVSLLGTDDFGNRYDRTVQTSLDGSYQFDELPPGSYTISQLQPVFNLDGGVSIDGGTSASSISDNAFTVDLTADGTSQTSFNFAEQGLEPQFSIWEALASTSSSGMYSAVTAEGEHHWTQVDSGWEKTEIVNVQMSSNKKFVTITIRENDNLLKTTVPTSGTSRVQMIGQDDGANLMRIRGTRSDFDFRP